AGTTTASPPKRRSSKEDGEGQDDQEIGREMVAIGEKAVDGTGAGRRPRVEAFASAGQLSGAQQNAHNRSGETQLDQRLPLKLRQRRQGDKKGGGREVRQG